MRLSIVVPVYNVEKYLDQCVQSILSLPQDIQILLVNDGSTDNSGKLCDAWANRDERIQVIHQPNAGLSAARNTGINAGTGDYVMFLDSDDFLDAEETKAIYDHLNGEADMVVGLYRKYYEAENRYEPECGSFGDNCGFMTRNDFIRSIPNATDKNSYLVAVRFIVKTQWLRNNQLFFYPGIYHEDEDWCVRTICKANDVYLTKNYFYQYRQDRVNSITSHICPKHVRDTFTIMERQQQLMDAATQDDVVREFLGHRIAGLYCSNILNMRYLNEVERENALKKLAMYTTRSLPYLSGKKGKVIKMLIRILGLKGAESVLARLQKIRGR